VTEPTPTFAELVAARGVAARPLGRLVALLAAPGTGVTLDELVRATALPRRAVEAALTALGADVVEADGLLRLRPGGASDDTPLPAAPVLGPFDPPPEGLVDVVRAAVASAPRPKRELDHVAATADTVARRAVWLAGTFALAGRRVLCVGDHDLTSVALAVLDPSIEVVVADMDEDVLAHVAACSPPGALVRTVFADFRLGLPARLRGRADLVVTDPPYTPEGVVLFARRGLEALVDHGAGRLVLAYGYGDQPGLGLNVQDALAGLRLAYEAVLPAFNRYEGAQAIGSASNLYVLRPTAGTRKALATADRAGGPNVYTHGRRSTEADAAPVTTEEVAALVAVATAPAPASAAAGATAGAGPVGPPGQVTLAVGEAWPAGAAWPGGEAPRRVPLAGCLVPDTPEASPCGAPPAVGDAAVADLRHDAGPLLLRLLLASRSPRLAVLVPNDHPDLADAAGQEALASLLAGTWVLRFRRSTPGPRLAIVEAGRVAEPGDDPAAVARRHVLDRPHAKLANACREALIQAAAGPLSKNEARALVASHVTSAGVDTDLSLVELPRAQVVTVLEALATAANR
jgi:N4-bis(aminopropyl)spermidine synthase